MWLFEIFSSERSCYVHISTAIPNLLREVMLYVFVRVEKCV